ncbi:MAG: hypothetical protein ACT4NY_28520 [Pseudonocardiales bacterium]
MDTMQRFLDAPVDYSLEFTERVNDLADSLSAALGVPVRHDTDMNYNPGQLLIVYLLPGGSVTSDERAASHAVKVAVSSRGPLWAMLVSRKGDRELEWFPSTVGEIEDGSAGDVFATIERTMQAAGLVRVSDNTLEELVPGRVTELDGAPATVRDLLFCELC